MNLLPFSLQYATPGSINPKEWDAINRFDFRSEYQAKNMGYSPAFGECLTPASRESRRYDPEKHTCERWMLRNSADDFKRRNRPFCFVAHKDRWNRDSVTIWSKPLVPIELTEDV